MFRNVGGISKGKWLNLFRQVIKSVIRASTKRKKKENRVRRSDHRILLQLPVQYSTSTIYDQNRRNLILRQVIRVRRCCGKIVRLHRALVMLRPALVVDVKVE